MSIRWTEEQWREVLARRQATLPDEVKALGLAKPASKKSNKTTKAPAVSEEHVTPKKRRGVDTNTIMSTLVSPDIRARYDASEQSLSLWFGGARLLSVNELFSIFQYRKHASFAYKKRWKALVKEALSTLGPVPCYQSTVRLTLYRSGRRLIDLDSFATIFKYLIDGLKDHGVLPDDNPWVVARIEPWQIQGAPEVGIRVEPIEAPPSPPQTIHEAWGLILPGDEKK